jgi:hypothetical protein
LQVQPTRFSAFAERERDDLFVCQGVRERVFNSAAGICIFSPGARRSH